MYKIKRNWNNIQSSQGHMLNSELGYLSVHKFPPMPSVDTRWTGFIKTCLVRVNVFAVMDRSVLMSSFSRWALYPLHWLRSMWLNIHNIFFNLMRFMRTSHLPQLHGVYIFVSSSYEDLWLLLFSPPCPVWIYGLISIVIRF